MSKKESHEHSLYKCRIGNWKDEYKGRVPAAMQALAFAVLKDMEGVRTQLADLELKEHKRQAKDRVVVQLPSTLEEAFPYARPDLQRRGSVSGSRLVTSEDIDDLLEAVGVLSRDNPHLTYAEALFTAALERGFRRIDQ